MTSVIFVLSQSHSQRRAVFRTQSDRFHKSSGYWDAGDEQGLRSTAMHWLTHAGELKALHVLESGVSSRFLMEQLYHQVTRSQECDR